MNIIKTKGIAVAAAATILLCPALCSCEGRTMHNMTPRGETVEVNPLPVPEADSIQADSIISLKQ